MRKKPENLIGRKIRALRVLRGMTQEAMADEIGMSFGNLGKIERGEIDPNTESLYKIAKSLEVDISELFEDDVVGEPYRTGYASREELFQAVKQLEILIKSEMAKIREEISRSRPTPMKTRRR
jgi:transcriptional regulator with XRE-family HTH domain